MSNVSSINPISSPYSNIEQAVILVVMSLLSLGSIFGNILVFVAYIKVKKLQRATNYFILSLAAADLFVGMLVINIYTMYMLLGHWPSTGILCLLWLCSDYWVFQASVFGVLMIAIDRYLSIRFPHRYRLKRSATNVKTAIFIMWIIAFALWVPLIVSYYITGENTETEVREEHVCHVRSDKNVYVTALASAFAYVIPVILIIILAIHTFYLLLNMKQPRKSHCYSRDSSAAESSTLDKSITDSNEFDSTQAPTQAGSLTPVTFKTKGCGIKFKRKNGPLISKARESPFVPITLDVKNVCKAYKNLDDFQRIATFNIIIAVAFVITVFPYGIISVIKAFCDSCVSAEWWHFAYIMCYINSLLNPLCYAFGNKNFNRAFKTILHLSRSTRKQDHDCSRTASVKEKVDDQKVIQNGADI